MCNNIRQIYIIYTDHSQPSIGSRAPSVVYSSSARSRSKKLLAGNFGWGYIHRSLSCCGTSGSTPTKVGTAASSSQRIGHTAPAASHAACRRCA
eukprot:SAG25_NODE_419_length_8245_cov_3.527744_2_plen_94_part_00